MTWNWHLYLEDGARFRRSEGEAEALRIIADCSDLLDLVAKRSYVAAKLKDPNLEVRMSAARLLLALSERIGVLAEEEAKRLAEEAQRN